MGSENNSLGTQNHAMRFPFKVNEIGCSNGSVSRFPLIAMSTCPLCDSPGPLRESHIIPRFVFEWLIQSSATGHMRLGTAPNLRVQDGVKQRLLCGECEGRLGAWEKTTAESLFVPYHLDTSVVVEYGPWLAKFCASVAWRVLFVFQRIGPNHMSAVQVGRADRALRVWSDLMFDRAQNAGSFELHLLPVDVMASANWPGMAANMNRYLARAIEMDVVASSQSAFVYVKMCKLIVIGFVQSPQFRQWRGTRVAMKRGTIRPGKFVVPSGFGDYLVERAKGMAQLMAGISACQKQKIGDSMRNNLDRAAQSETFVALSHDVGMFGNLAFEPPDE